MSCSAALPPDGRNDIVVSLRGRWLAPGVLSSPLLLAAAVWLLYETAHVPEVDA